MFLQVKLKLKIILQQSKKTQGENAQEMPKLRFMSILKIN